MFSHGTLTTVCEQRADRDDHTCRRQNARKEEKEMYDMAKKTRQEDTNAGRSGNRADKPVSDTVCVAMTGLCTMLHCCCIVPWHSYRDAACLGTDLTNCRFADI